MRILMFCLLLLTSHLSFAANTYWTAAGMAQQYPEEETEYGLSLRALLSFHKNGGGFFYHLNAPGDNLTQSDVAVGYSFRFGTKSVFELGAGAYWGAVPGLGAVGLVAYDYEVTPRLSFYFPLIYKSGLRGIEFAPYVGWRF